MAGIMLASPFTRWVADQLNHQPSLCPLLRLTGMPCPSCGGTRASLYLLSGDPIAALRANAGLTVFVMAFAVFIAVTGVQPFPILGVANPHERVAD